MTTTEIQAWVDANFTGNPKISPSAMRTFWGMLRDNYSHVDDPLGSYSAQIENADLDGNLQITITHNLGTLVPDFVMQDENGSIMYDDYFEARVITADTIQLTFFDVIPATGSGYYLFTCWYIIDQVPARYNQVFTSPFTDWTGDVPDGFTVETPFLGSPTCEEDTDRAKLTRDGMYRCRLLPVLTLEINRNYRITIKIDLGNVVLISGSSQVTLSTTGTFTVLLMAADTELVIKQGSADIAIIDSILIEEEL